MKQKVINLGKSCEIYTAPAQKLTSATKLKGLASFNFKHPTLMTPDEYSWSQEKSCAQLCKLA